MTNANRFPATVTIYLLVCAALSLICTTSNGVQRRGKPAPTFANVKYGPYKRNVLDFWRAKSEAPTPLVVYIHGGGFRAGSKNSINAGVLRELLDAGISVAAINYRFVAQAPLPAAHYDSRRALQFLRSKADEWNIDKQRVGAFGGSAGAQLCMYLAFHDEMAKSDSADPIERESSRLQCVATTGGQTTMDFGWWMKHIPGYTKPHRPRSEYFGDLSKEAYLEKVKEISALSLISKDDPPIFMSYGMAPKDAVPKNPKRARGWKVHHVMFGVKLKEKMDELRIEAELKYPGAKTNYRSIPEFFREKLVDAKGEPQFALQKNSLWVYIGTYTTGDSKSKGIYKSAFEPATGKLSRPLLVAKTTNPSFLALHPNNRYLYAVNEVGNYAKKENNGALSAFAIDPKTGKLKLLNIKETGGGAPCHLNVDAAGKHVLVANYTGGNACVYRISKDGSLGKQTAFVQHEEGSGVNPKRQEKPHAHSIDLDKANRFAFIADLGMDKVMIYKYDAAKGTLTPNSPPSMSMAAGAGPRHFALHPNGRFAYAINELDSTVTAMAYDSKFGSLQKLQTVTTLPKDYDKHNSTAEVFVHPSGKFLYGSNRGHNSIAVFSINQKTGKLRSVGHQGMNIDTPRNFGIDPSGQFMIVANQGSNSLVVFRIDERTGSLVPTDVTVALPRPVCVVFYSP